MFPAAVKSERGSAILENLIASAIITLGIAQVTQALTNQTRSAKELNDRFTRAELANGIMESVDCAETIYQNCEKGRHRIYSRSGPLFYALPYAADATKGVAALRVDCLGGVVNVQIEAGGSPLGPALIPGGLCRRRFDAPKKCPAGQKVVGIDDERGEIQCATLAP